MVAHKCKSWPHFFQAIVEGKKTHDLRLNDRNFQVGDKILLEEYDPFLGKYSGRSFWVVVTFVTSYETPCAFSSAVLPKDYAILSIQSKYKWEQENEAANQVQTWDGLYGTE